MVVNWKESGFTLAESSSNWFLFDCQEQQFLQDLLCFWRKLSGAILHRRFNVPAENLHLVHTCLCCCWLCDVLIRNVRQVLHMYMMCLAHTIWLGCKLQTPQNENVWDTCQHAFEEIWSVVSCRSQVVHKFWFKSSQFTILLHIKPNHNSGSLLSQVTIQVHTKPVLCETKSFSARLLVSSKFNIRRRKHIFLLCTLRSPFISVLVLSEIQECSNTLSGAFGDFLTFLSLPCERTRSLALRR